MTSGRSDLVEIDAEFRMENDAGTGFAIWVGDYHYGTTREKWVWWPAGDPPRWLLAVQDQDPAYKHSLEWRLYEISGRYCSRQIQAVLNEHYTHHTPIYPPRSTPE